MTRTCVAFTHQEDSVDAGRELGKQIAEHLENEPADAVVVFASSQYHYEQLLQTLQQVCNPKLLLGSSSAGEFTNEAKGEGGACALALRSSAMRFSLGVGRNLSADRAAAARQVVESFRGLTSPSGEYRSALVMTDALAGHADDLVDQLTLATAGKYQFFGGGAGDDARFQKTHVFYGVETLTNAVVALEIVSSKPLGIGVGHGWEPASAGLRVTQAEGMTLISLNGMPAVHAFQAHAEATGQEFDPGNALPFFLHNIVGIDTGAGHRLRVPLAVNGDGSVSCAADIPEGATIHLMKTTANSAMQAAATAARSALDGLQGNKPQVAIFFDCVATRLRLGDVFGFELKSLADTLGGAEFVGCNTYGQIARAQGQFGGFHNCTAVVCVLPE